MLNNVERLKHKIKLCIDQGFKELDKELNSLKRKVAELTNHITVPRKKDDHSNANDYSDIEISFQHTDHDTTDDWQLLIHVKPTGPDQGLKDVTRLCNLVYYSNTTLWNKLTGGGDSHFFAKDLKKHPTIYNYVMKELQYYITYVQQIYPALVHVKGGAILSAPNAPVQINCHYGKLPSNYTANVMECPSDGSRNQKLWQLTVSSCSTYQARL
jgi:hypothetical protein